MKKKSIEEVKPSDTSFGIRFQRKLNEKIDMYMSRPEPKAGRRYIRTPYDSLIEAERFTEPAIIAEYNLIKEGKSILPRLQRDAIEALMTEVFLETQGKKAKIKEKVIKVLN